MSKLKISDLSAGDWVKVDIYPNSYKILDISGNGYVWLIGRERLTPIGVVTPIPITPEMLKENGVYNSDYEVWCIGSRVVVSRERRKYRVHIYDCHINHTELVVFVEYVHQLQHALRLAGIDKEIELQQNKTVKL